MFTLEVRIKHCASYMEKRSTWSCKLLFSETHTLLCGASWVLPPAVTRTGGFLEAGAQLTQCECHEEEEKEGMKKGKEEKKEGRKEKRGKKEAEETRIMDNTSCYWKY